jgi:hypothetical protein
MNAYCVKDGHIYYAIAHNLLPAFFSDCMALENGTDKLSRNVGNQPPTYAGKNSTQGDFLDDCREDVFCSVPLNY